MAKSSVGCTQAISRITRQMMQTLREALAHLRPPDLKEFGLQQALQRLVGTWRRREAPAFGLAVDGDLATVPGPVALSVFRVVQQCLTNAVHHGRPTEIGLHLGVSVDAVTVVRDDCGVPAVTDVAEGTGSSACASASSRSVAGCGSAQPKTASASRRSSPSAGMF